MPDDPTASRIKEAHRQLKDRQKWRSGSRSVLTWAVVFFFVGLHYPGPCIVHPSSSLLVVNPCLRAMPHSPRPLPPCPTCGEDHGEGEACAALSVTRVSPKLEGKPAKAGKGSLIGATLGAKYRITRVIGEGGMGTVFEAEHVLLGRTVAVKVLLPYRLGSEEAVRRFQREARAAAAIGHPNICDVYDYGQLANGAPYLVMEKLVGETLAGRIEREKTLSPPFAVDVLLQVLSGLAAAHAKGIIHRDIKPENVFLAERQGLAPIAKVLDFGISKMIGGAAAAGGSFRTEVGTLLGTAFYLAPEQARGRDVDARVDLYACGVMLYETLTGERPFVAPTLQTLLLKIAEGAPIPSVRAIRPELPEELDRVLARAMAHDRDARYPTAADFQADLTRVIATPRAPAPPRPAVASRPSSEGASGAPSVAPPLEIGRYVLFNVIASGGMASVHYGRQVGASGFRRTVAVKRLHPHYARDPAFRSMFVDEARLAARVLHPNVVPTLDVAADQDELFLVMEYVPGETLGRLLHRTSTLGERIPPNVVAAILAGALHGLHAAHDATAQSGQPLSIVHRDVSPQNILVGTDGTARLLDFGVAKASERIAETRDGTVKGKPSYLAPEQIRRGTVDRRTDIYAATVVLWEALVGERLFEGPNEASVFEQILLGMVDPPSLRAPDVPAAFDEIVARGLDIDPARRYSSAREMALDIERAITPALPSDVAAWVESTVGEALAERAALVAAIEKQHVEGDAEEPGRSSFTSVSSRAGRVTAATPLPSPAARRGWIWGVAALAVVACVAAGAAVRRSGSRAQDSNAIDAAAESVAVSQAASPEGVSGALLPAPAPPPTATSPATGQGKNADIEIAEPTRSAPPSAGASSKRARKEGCDPPFVRDATGAKLWKRECL